jgi:hypothetical protein
MVGFFFMITTMPIPDNEQEIILFLFYFLFFIFTLFLFLSVITYFLSHPTMSKHKKSVRSQLYYFKSKTDFLSCFSLYFDPKSQKEEITI